MIDLFLDSFNILETIILGLLFQWTTNRHFKRLEKTVLILHNRTEKLIKGEDK